MRWSLLLANVWPLQAISLAMMISVTRSCFIFALKVNCILPNAQLDTVFTAGIQIFSKFLHDEYGGPGTLLLEPFTDMMLALKDENLPGAAFAARAAVLWAQSYLDRDWESWHAANRQTSLWSVLMLSLVRVSYHQISFSVQLSVVTNCTEVL